MSPSLTFELLFVMVIILFFLGMASTITGIVILTTRATGRDIQTIATQTTRLAQKGLAEEVAGLVGNASSLLDAMNQLIRTASIELARSRREAIIVGLHPGTVDTGLSARLKQGGVLYLAHD